MTFHHLFVTAGYVIPALESVPVWLPAFALIAVVIAWVTRRRDRHRFQETAADAARAPLPKRPLPPVIDTRPGVDQEALATCNAILYVTIIGEQR